MDGVKTKLLKDKKLLKVVDLRRKLKRINVLVKILEKKATKEVFSKVTRRYHYITEYVVGDETGIISLVVWNKSKDFKPGKTYLLEDVDVTFYNGIPKIIVRDDSSISLAKKDIRFSDINTGYRSEKKKK